MSPHSWPQGLLLGTHDLREGEESSEENPIFHQANPGETARDFQGDFIAVVLVVMVGFGGFVGYG